MEFNIELARSVGVERVKTRCGYDVITIGETHEADLPVYAIVKEVVSKGRRRRPTRVENNIVLYHADGKLHEDKDDDFDLVIMED